ncbi:hypothetical protein [Candidatus Regiella insecticola]|nr:hypothetical protein [Candidatus Regiella insecticola]
MNFELRQSGNQSHPRSVQVVMTGGSYRCQRRCNLKGGGYKPFYLLLI